MQTITGQETGTQFINKLNANFAEAGGADTSATKKVELLGGALSTSTGAMLGTYADYAKAKQYHVSPRYINVKGASRSLSISGTTSSEQYAVFQYADDYTFISASFVNYDATTTLNDSCAYIKVAVKNTNNSNYSYDKRIVTLNIDGINGLESYNGGTPSTGIFHTFDVRQPYADREFAANATYTGNTGRLLTRGYIYLPPNYTQNGRPVPVIIHCHGTSGMQFDANALPYNGAYMEFLANCGYAVIGCSTVSELYPSVVDADLVHPLGFACIGSMWDFMHKMYNIADEVFIFGYSAGGMYTTMMSEQGRIPFRAAASLAGSLDLFCNMRACIKEVDQRWLTLLGIDDLTISNNYMSSQGSMKPVDSAVKTYFLANIDKFAGFNPFWFGSDMDRSAFLTEFLSVNATTAVLSANSTLQGIVDAARIHRKVPIKIWHAVDDVNVPIQMSRWYVQMVKRGGGIAIMREISAEHGAHHAPGLTTDTSGVIPMTNYTTRYGGTYSVPVAYAEMVDWFNQW